MLRLVSASVCPYTTLFRSVAAVDIAGQCAAHHDQDHGACRDGDRVQEVPVEACDGPSAGVVIPDWLIGEEPEPGAEDLSRGLQRCGEQPDEGIDPQDRRQEQSEEDQEVSGAGEQSASAAHSRPSHGRRRVLRYMEGTGVARAGVIDLCGGEGVAHFIAPVARRAQRTPTAWPTASPMVSNPNSTAAAEA